MTEKELADKRQVNFERYAKKYGKKAVETDFVQPEDTKKFTEIYGGDDEKMKTAYTDEELESQGLGSLAEEKRLEREIDKLKGQGKTIEAAKLEGKKNKLKEDRNRASKIVT